MSRRSCVKVAVWRGVELQHRIAVGRKCCLELKSEEDSRPDVLQMEKKFEITKTSDADVASENEV